jgi:hypothetical protein
MQEMSMNRFNKFLAVMFLSAAMLFTGAAQAMKFSQFDKMTIDDQAEFIALMVDATQKALRNEGRSDFAAQIEHLFTTIDPGDSMSLGLVELERNVAQARLADVKGAEKDPKAQRLDVEDALFVTLEKNKIPMTTNVMNAVMDALANFHAQTYAEFEAKSPAEQRRFIALLVKLAWPDYMFRDALRSRMESRKDSNLSRPGVKRDMLTVINTKFPSQSLDQPGFAEVAKAIKTEYKKAPNRSATFITLQIYILEQLDALTVQRIKKMDETSVVLPDGRHIFPDKNGDFWFWAPGASDRGDSAIKLEAQYKALAQRLYECKESRRISNGVEALAACRDQVGVSGAAASKPAPAPAPNRSMTNEDDPIGEGGFITPYILPKK